jgi:hypothetical protein
MNYVKKTWWVYLYYSVIVIGPYFFAESAVTSHNYLDMLELFALPQTDDDNEIFQQDGAPAH